MTRKTNQSLRKFLIFAAIIAFVVGLGWSYSAGKERAHDVKKIDFKIVQKEDYYNPDESPYSNGCYHIGFDFKIKNGTSATLGWLRVKTTVMDKSGKELGYINSEFGGYGSGTMALKAKKSTTITTTLSENQPEKNEFFVELYNADLKDLRFKFEVTGSHFDD